MSTPLHATEEQELLGAAARDLLAKRMPLSSLDEVERGEPTAVVEELWEELGELGWLALLVPEAHGGSGGSPADVAILCGELGRALCPAPYVAVAVVAVRALADVRHPAAATLLAGVASGRRRPVLAATTPHGLVDPDRLPAFGPDGRVRGTCGLVDGANFADAFLVMVATPDGPAMVELDARGPGVTVRPTAAIVRNRWASVELDGAPAEMLATGWTPVGALAVAAAMEAAWCAGATRRLLADTVDYASARNQFGVPIGSFQAVQHRLADCDIAAAEAETLATVAAHAIGHTAPGARHLASIAFLRATDAFVQTARSCHQVWGGMGFSIETPVHHFSRRAKASRHAWGGPAYHQAVVATELRTTALLRDWYADRTGAAVPAEPALDSQVETFRQEVRSFIAAEYDPVIPTQGPFPQMDTPEKRAFVGKLAARGWLGLTWPVTYGGQGRDEIYQLVLQEELEYMGLPSMSIEVGMIGQTLLRHGSDELKANVLPRILRGELNIALGYSEPQAGSDLAALELRAVRDGDTFVLDGQKMWTSGAHFADLVWLACRTNTEVPRHRGISLLLVDLDAPGIEVQRVDTMGDHRTNAVFFDGVRVPATRLVGEIDRGWDYLMEALDYERLRGFPFGALQRDLDELVAWAREHDRWDRPAVRELVVEFAIRVEGARMHLLRSWDRLLRHEVPTFEATMLKVALTETRQDLADAVIDVVGPDGLLHADDPSAPMHGRFEHNWRAEIITTIAGGANEIQRNILAARHLGLPSGARRP